MILNDTQFCPGYSICIVGVLDILIKFANFQLSFDVMTFIPVLYSIDISTGSSIFLRELLFILVVYLHLLPVNLIGAGGGGGGSSSSNDEGCI